MGSAPLKAVFLEPKPPNPHIFSLYALPRLGSVLLATLLKERGWDVQVFVEEVAPIDFGQVLAADLVGISTITSTAPRGYALAEEISRAGVPTVLGGPHVSFLPEEGLRHGEMVVRGEGEGPILALARHFEDGLPLEEVPGLSWRRGAAIVHNTISEAFADLDGLPSPDFSLISGYVRDRSLASRVIPIQTTRGCPYDCQFCSVTGMFGRRLRRRSPEKVVEELTAYRKLGGLAFFYDDNFTSDRAHVREICRLILESGLDMNWSTQVRLEAARDAGLLRLMRQAGCRTVFVGFESVNQEALDESRKSQSAGDMESAVRAFRRNGIDVHGMFIYGLDSDRVQDLDATLRFAMRTPITTAQFLILTPFPGTGLLKSLHGQDRILLDEWGLYDGHHVVFEPRNLSPRQLQRKQIRSHGRFYSRSRSLGNLLKLEVVRTGVYLYARRVNARWKSRNRSYMEALRRFPGRGLAAVKGKLRLQFPDVRAAVERAKGGPAAVKGP